MILIGSAGQSLGRGPTAKYARPQCDHVALSFFGTWPAHLIFVQGGGRPPARWSLGVFIVGGCTVEPEETTDTAVQSLAGAPITVSPRASAVSEAGGKAYFTVAFQGSPHGPVRIDIAVDPPSEARAVPSTLIFMPGDSAPRSFRVEAIDDDVFDGDIRAAVKLAVLSADPRYRYQPPPIDVLSVDDDYTVTGYRTVALFGDGEAGESGRINNRGQVVAELAYYPSGSPADQLHGYLWDKGTITDLGYPTRPTDLNDAGVVVGFYGDDRYWFRYENGETTFVPGQARAINARGHTAGDALYVDGQRTELHDGQAVIATALNSNDHVTGSFAVSPFNGQDRPFYWDGAFRDLGSLGGPRGQGLSINEHDQLVGFMWDPMINYHAIYFDGSAVVDLGRATNMPGSLATAINNRGDIVGHDHDGGLATQGWIGRVGEPLATLQSKLVDGRCFTMMEVQDINDGGEILARAWECDIGSPRSYLFEPIKAPR